MNIQYNHPAHDLQPLIMVDDTYSAWPLELSVSRKCKSNNAAALRSVFGPDAAAVSLDDLREICWMGGLIAYGDPENRMGRDPS